MHRFSACFLLVLATILTVPASAVDIRVWPSGKINVTRNNQTISNKIIRVRSGTGITINDKSGVRIQNCLINFDVGTTGLSFRNAPGLEIVNCEFRLIGAPKSAPLPKRSRAIVGSRSKDIEIRQVTFRDCGAGIKLFKCNNSKLTKLAGFNFRGPLPDGQLIQFNRCTGGLVEDFSVRNDLGDSWPEDSINCYRSHNQTFRRGLVQGNNAPSGVGILWEEQGVSDSSGGFGGLIEDVDFVQMGNGAVGGADGSKNIVFRRVRIKDTHTTGKGGRAAPRSGSLLFSGFGTNNNPGINLKVEGAKIFNIANRNNIFFPKSSFTKKDVRTQDFSRRGIINNKFVWLRQ